METIFKKGDKVFDIRYGWGVVTFVNTLAVDWPIEVLFDGKEELTDDYTFDGRAFINYPPTLSFTEYTLEGFSQERPEELPDVGQVVWVRKIFPSEWMIGHFREKKKDRYYISSCNNEYNDFGFEIRTTNPYANEHN